MKTLCRNIKNSFLLLVFLTLALPVMSADKVEVAKKRESIGLTLNAQGEVFVINENRTRNLETSDYIYDFSEIVTGENSLVTFKDNFDHKYHLAPGSHVKILNRIIELKSGYLWVKSENSEKGFSVQTANSKIAYNQGEAIITFDALAGKTQLLVIRGEMEFSNILLEDNKVAVTDANFSFLTGDLENSAPRPPTGIGQASFSKVVSIFMGVKPEQGALAIEHNQIQAKEVAQTQDVVAPKKVERSIASVSSEDEGESKKVPGKFVYVTKSKVDEEGAEKTKKLESLYNQNLMDQKKNLVKKHKVSFKPNYNMKSSVAIKIYGQKKAHPVRLPAAVDTPEAVDSYENVNREMRQQNEANDLIHQLNNYKAD